MATSTVAQEPSLVAKFDDIVAGVNVLCDGTEDAFVEFLNYHTNMSAKEVGNLKKEICELKGENEAKDIKLKLSRNSLEEQMNECGILKERLKEYEKQFTILKVLLNSDDKQYQLNEAERRSLALLKKINPGISPGYESGGEYPSPDASINVTDATLDDDEGSVSYRTKWKRRRTASVECALESSLSKRKRSIENVLSDKKETVTKYRDSFGLGDEIHMTPPLEQKFKKPQPDKNRRKPSRGHLEKLNDYVAMPTTVPPVVPPLNLPPDTDDIVVIPSAPSEIEVALVDSGGQSSLAYSPQQLMKPEPPYYHEISPLPVTTSIGLYPSLAPPLPMEDMSPHPQGSNSQRKHTFFNKTVVKPEICQVCKKKIRFAKNCFKCKDCRAFCHSDCKDKLSLPCVPNVPTPKKKHKESELSAFCPHSIPRVPSLVVHCVSEIERRGMNQVGLYRIPGSDRSIKELKERLLTARGSPSLDKVEDVNTICGCLKQFLIHLQEPLVTYKMQPAFIQANDSASEKIALAELLEAIAQLPPCNKDTLAFLILHLQRVASCSDANKMPIPCLARVFAPTIIGSSSSEPDAMFKDIQKQQQVMERLLHISSDYWCQYLSPDDNPEPQSPTPSQPMSSCPSTPPNMMTSPSTPELMPVPQSPFLGSYQSPYGGNRGYKTPVVTRSTSNGSIPPYLTRSVKKGSTYLGGFN